MTRSRTTLHSVTLAAALIVGGLLLPVGAAGAQVVASASGSGLTSVGDNLRTFSFVATLDAAGVATGTAQVNNRGVGEKFQLKLDCLNVVGNLAIASGVIVRHDDAHAIGLTGIFAVLDSGEGAGSAPDQATQVFLFPPGLLTCADLGPVDAAPFLVEIEGGNVQVR